ncbi:EF-P lysine aminoacylase EpmA [Desulfatiferula olefinivorans]
MTRDFSHLRTRAHVMRLVRSFFYDRGYLEVDTPIRQPALIPEAHIDPVESEGACLQASPEICMKQLMARGLDRLFQIARVFRKHERGRKHLPEFTLLEWYAAGADYRDLMTDTEALVRDLARNLGCGSTLAYQGARIDLGRPFDRISVAESFDLYGSMTMAGALSVNAFDEVMGLEIEPRLGWDRPVFLYDYPAEKASLARLRPDDPSVAERVEVYIAGLELANGFSELTSSDEQRLRFDDENRIRRDLGKPVYPLPSRFLDALDYMPEAAGMALGLDRLIMLFCDAATIDEVVPFVPETL